MKDQNFGFPITTADVHVFPKQSVDSRLGLSLSGVFGGATVTLGWVSPAGNFVSFKRSDGITPITATSDEAWVTEIPPGGKYALTTTGVTGTTSLKLELFDVAP